MTELDLGKEQAVLAAVVFPFGFGKEWSEASQPLLPTGQQILGCERVGQFLQPFWVSASEEGIGALL
jgi:hypothetical protein